MKDLLKEAIADAKAVRETALANAKLALEEAFAPRIQSMISSHLQQEAEEEMMDEEDDEMTAMGDSEAPAEEEMPTEEMPAEEMPAEEPVAAEEPAVPLSGRRRPAVTGQTAGCGGQQRRHSRVCRMQPDRCDRQIGRAHV